ncbi:MAG TPA: ABC transporter permease [Chitinophagaceae bacterium]
MNLLISLRSELLKTRKASFYLTLIGAAVGPVMYLLNILLDEGESDSLKKDPLNAVYKILSDMNGTALFPLFIILICTLLPQIEYRNNTWKQVFASPQTKGNVFLAKFINVHLLMLVFLIATHLFMFLAIVGINFIKPTLNLFEHPLNGNRVLVNAANAYILVLAICAIQFWIGLRSRNFIVPIGIGFALWLAGTIMAVQYKSNLVFYFPYSFNAFPVSTKLKSQLTQVAWTSLGYALLFLIVGFFDFRRRTVSK